MPLPTCAVQCYVYTQDGDPEPNAVITAKLNRYEVYQGHVVPEQMTATTDADGLAVLDLWPNELGSTGSAYTVKIQPVGKKILTVNAVVPLAVEASLADISTLPAYDGKPDGQLGVELANAALVAANNAVNSASASATTAGEQAGIATTQANAAASAAGAASSSAGAASSSAGAAATSEGVATTQAGIATGAAGTATTQAGIATTQAGISTTQAGIATAQAAAAAASAIAAANAGASFRNKVINGDFTVNQRNVSGSVVLAAGVHGHDRWKAGASGCTYTFASSGGVTTITISAGSLIHVVDGANLQTGTHVMSWAGTAQGKIAAGSYGASGQTYAATGGTNVNIEFNTGTLSLVQFEPGTVPTAPDRRLNELQLCQRYAVPLPGRSICQAISTTSAFGAINVPVAMRALPSLPAGSFNVSTAAGAGLAATPVLSLGSGLTSFNLAVTSASGLVAGNATFLYLPTGGMLSADL